MELYEGKKYFTTKEGLKATLEQFGVAIIPEVISQDECTSMISGIWDYFEHISQSWELPISRSNEESWKGFYSLCPAHAMLVQHYGIGQAQVSWDLRQKESIVDIFAHFWDCKKEELLVSFDALSLAIPFETTNRGWFKGNTWYHADQSYTRSQFECIQSWVSGFDVNPGDATLGFFETSHKHQIEFKEKFNVTDKTDWYKLKPEEQEFYIAKGCKEKRIMCPKGSLVFWDSRTIHCGVEALKERPTPNFRAVVYLCYMPRNKATKAALKKKIKTFEELRTTNHWPCKPKLFAKLPYTYGKHLPEITSISAPVLTALGRSLVGYENDS
jgi:hypothetical protein